MTRTKQNNRAEGQKSRLPNEDARETRSTHLAFTRRSPFLPRSEMVRLSACSQGPGILLIVPLKRSGPFLGSSFLWASFPSPIFLPLPISCCGTLSFELPLFLFLSCLAFDTFTCLIDFHRFRGTMADIEIATLPAEMVPSSFGSFVSAGPGAICDDAVVVSVGNVATT